MLYVITCTCILGPHHLIMYTCTCYARHLALLYVLAGLRLTTLNSHVQILKTRPWRPCCSRLECAADPSVTIGVQKKFGSSPQLYLPVPLLFSSETPLVAREHLSVFVYLFIYCTFVSSSDVIFPQYCITLCDDHVLVLFYVGMYITTVLPSLILA